VVVVDLTQVVHPAALVEMEVQGVVLVIVIHQNLLAQLEPEIPLM
tara:strand:+ start:17 stop:151 length:135 start_codon:yes stop_codon:yes gene_type:complete